MPSVRQEIRRFLTARRSAITPESVGLPSGSRRRTPGLRREELATLAGIGVAWYTWLEQGRNIQVSARVLGRIAHALRLTRSDTEYLFSLCGVPRAEGPRCSHEQGDRAVHETVNGFQAGPAICFSQYWEALAYNRLADVVFDFDNYHGPFARNHIWRLFMDPQRRARYLDWERLAEISVRWARAVYGKAPEEPYLNRLIGALCEGSDAFRRLWDAQLTSPALETVSVGMKIPRFGPLQFTSTRFCAFESQRNLALLTPADARTAAVMRELATSFDREAIPERT